MPNSIPKMWTDMSSWFKSKPKQNFPIAFGIWDQSNDDQAKDSIKN